jgi:hypothetical protein
MKFHGIFRYVFLCSLAILSCKKDAAGIQEGEFTVLSYNVAGLPEGISQSNPVRYSDSIGKLVNEFDIVHVQEDFCYHHQLTKHIRHPYMTEPSGCVPFGDGLNTFSRFLISGFKRIKWQHCNGTDCLTPKGFSFSRILIAPGHNVDFYNVHCNAGSDFMDLLARRKNIHQLCEYIKTHSEDKAVIVMGDMNCRYTRTGDTIRELLSLGFTDVFIQLLQNNVIPEIGFPSLNDCGDIPTGTSCEPVDKIFYRSSASVQLTPLSYQHDDSRYYYTNGDPLSDHSPLFARFHFKASP